MIYFLSERGVICTVTVYVDILILLNSFVDFFILLVTSAVCGEKPRVLRIVLASFCSALFSLVIFLPSGGFLAELGIRLACSTVTVLICFGFVRPIRFLRKVAVFYGISFIYAGIMLALWFIFEPESMSINNGVVYVGISPAVLIGATLASYIILTVIRRISRKNGSFGETVGLKLVMNGKEVPATALVDTGHSVRDSVADSVVIIADRRLMGELLGDDFCFLESESFAPGSLLYERYRLIPCSTVSGKTLLKAVRADKVRVYSGDTVFTVNSPVVALSEAGLGGDYDAVVGREILQVTL